MKLSVKEMAVFGMLGAVMFVSKLLTEWLPNIHLVGVLLVAFTVVYRQKALYPLYVFVLLTGVYAGFASWWVPYLYIWTVLWGAVMLLPRQLPKKAAPFIYMGVCALHGLLYGTLYAPAQALLFGMGFKATLAWIVAGLPFDAVHAAGNLVAGVLISPLVLVLKRAEKATAGG